MDCYRQFAERSASAISVARDLALTVMQPACLPQGGLQPSAVVVYVLSALRGGGSAPHTGLVVPIDALHRQEGEAQQGEEIRRNQKNSDMLERVLE